MDQTKVSTLENLLRLPGSAPGTVVSDTSVLTCGCLVSESQFGNATVCPNCGNQASILKPVAPLRDLYRFLQQSRERPRRKSLRRSVRTSEKAPDMDLMDLFCKYAKEEAGQPAPLQRQHLQLLLVLHSLQALPLAASAESVHTLGLLHQQLQQAHQQPQSQHQQPPPTLLAQLPQEGSLTHMQPRSRTEVSVSPRDQSAALRAILGLSDREEYNFSRCFPFHRKVSSFATQQTKFLLRLKKAANFLALAIATRVDRAGAETTLFALISDHRWELWLYKAGRPILVACGRLTGEYGPLTGAMKMPVSEGPVVRNEFSGNENSDDADVPGRLHAWVQLYCCLSDRYLVILGTRGVLRVLNVDDAAGDVGAPVYTYLTNFPIRCIAIAPDSSVIGCGITARERVSGKLQPFVVLHNMSNGKGRSSVGTSSTTNATSTASGAESDSGPFGAPTTITVPYRDPLKVLAFNSSGTHLLCCTVYEMRYFMVRLRDSTGDAVRRPRLVWSDRRVKRRRRTSSSGSSSDDTNINDDDHVLDNEGITDIRFGVPFSNTVVVTSSLLKLRPPIVLKLAGATIDHRLRDPRDVTLDMADMNIGDMTDMYGEADSDSDDNHAVAGASVLMKIPEVGSNVYRLAVSPRGDGLVFVDKLGRLLLVATANMHTAALALARRRVVLLGEAADALRFSEAASVCFLSDGGKIFVVDRKGLFQVFDFTKGVPGEDPDVIKCKIISV